MKKVVQADNPLFFVVLPYIYSTSALFVDFIDRQGMEGWAFGKYVESLVI